MTRRVTVSVLALLFSAAASGPLYSQSQSATQAKPTTGSTPAAPAKWVPPLKGEGTIEVIKGKPRRVGADMVTTLKIKNTSKGPLALLMVDEYWYSSNPAVKDSISGDTQRYKGLVAPGQVIELTTKSPYRADMSRNLFMFRHANGTIKAKQVEKFADK